MLRLISFIIVAATVPAAAFAQLITSDQDTYFLERRKLQADNRALSFDAAMTLTPAEQRLERYLIHLREELIERYKKAKRFPPAEPFYAVKDEIARTELYRFLRSMPRAGVLHIHTSSTAPADWVVTQGIREPGCHIYWPKGPINQRKPDSEGVDAIKGQIRFFAVGKAPPGYQPAAKLLRDDPAFSARLKTLLTINQADAKLTDLQIWRKFDQIFQRMGGLVSYEPVFAKYYTAAFETILEDGLFYVEMRTGFGSLYDLEGNTYDYRKKTALLWKVRNELRKRDQHFDLKLIYSGWRGGKVKSVWNQLQEAVAMRKQWQRENFVIGFDLVGEEDAGRTTEFFLPDWVKLKPYLREQGMTLPLYFHDGESDWSSDDNLLDAYLLDSKRIGHGFNLFRFPRLETFFKKKDIALEICPISNQLLRYVKDLRIHPANGYLRRGVPCVLGNDDPGILGNDGLSYDYWLATLAWDLDLRAIKQLARNSLHYSGMTDGEKNAALAHWRQQWNDWVQRTKLPTLEDEKGTP